MLCLPCVTPFAYEPLVHEVDAWGSLSSEGTTLSTAEPCPPLPPRNRMPNAPGARQAHRVVPQLVAGGQAEGTPQQARSPCPLLRALQPIAAAG